MDLRRNLPEDMNTEEKFLAKISEVKNFTAYTELFEHIICDSQAMSYVQLFDILEEITDKTVDNIRNEPFAVYEIYMCKSFLQTFYLIFHQLEEINNKYDNLEEIEKKNNDSEGYQSEDSEHYIDF